MVSQDVARIVLIGVGATLVMDVWIALLGWMGVPTLNFALVGRWIGHALRGQFTQVSIAKAQRIPGELAWGWLTHYAAGVAFAVLLVCIQGMQWARNPSVLPAIVVGMATVVVPLFVMQPAMGAGFAASRTPTPLRNCLRSTVNHTVFGLGLYLAAAAIDTIFS